jgi:SAM-dependent methyltransferase
MFSESADLYDKIYTKLKNYSKEAKEIEVLIKNLCPNAKTVLDVACGTGEHAKFLSTDYQVDGIDLNAELIQIASRKNPRGQYHVGDMIDFNLGKRYDVLICLFSSVGYVRTTKNLQTTIASFDRHLNDGGVMLIEPWFTPDAWRRDVLHMITLDEDQFKVCRMNVSEVKDKRLSFFQFHYLIGTPQGVRHFTEDHTLGLFTVAEMKAAFAANGLVVQYEEQGISGRGLYVAQRAQTPSLQNSPPF